MNILLVAEESAGLQALRILISGKHRLVAVMAQPPKDGPSTTSVWSAARDMGLETWPAKLVKDPALADRLRSKDVDILLNIHSLYIIHRNALAAPRFGAFNLHPGLLPCYAGINTISWAIYRGEKTHGVTVHKMEPEIDTGPIVYQLAFPIAEEDTALSLSFKCLKEGLRLIVKLLEVASADPAKIPLRPQDLSRRQYFGSGVPGDGRLSWSWPAEKIVNFVRACDYFPFRSPWGHPRTRLGEQDLAVVKASRTAIRCDVPPGTVGPPASSAALVASADEWVSVKKFSVCDQFLNPGDIVKSGDRLSDP